MLKATILFLLIPLTVVIIQIIDNFINKILPPVDGGMNQAPIIIPLYLGIILIAAIIFTIILGTI